MKGNLKYSIKSDNLVSVSGVVKKSTTTVEIPDIVKIGGKRYKVTAISKEAFKNNNKLKRVIIGKILRI